MISFIRFLLAFAVMQTSFSVSAQPMDFKLIPPDKPTEVFGNSWQIFADGEVKGNSAERLDALMKKYDVPARSTIHLNSLGGSLGGGIELGRVIRKYGLYTNVNKYQKDHVERLYDGYEFHKVSMLPGECMSACIYIYTGGVFRFLSNGSVLGVHQFYATNDKLGSDVTQLTSAVVLQYLREMGIDEALYSEMAVANKDQINILSRSLAQRLNVVNEGNEKVAWSIESLEQIMYVKAERQTWRGINKFLVSCEPKTRKIYTLFIFDAEGRADEILTMKALSIFLNSRDYPVNAYLVGFPIIKERVILVEFSLPEEFLDRMLGSNTVGVAFQFAYGAPIFAGFDGLEMKEGRSRVKTLMGLCR